ncbi:hypothetical protein HAX54_027117, partial [Datura stramonium]|nr:hypothetical protein [Datura stramonium]
LRFTISAILDLCFNWAILASSLSSLAVSNYCEVTSASPNGLRAFSMAQVRRKIPPSAPIVAMAQQGAIELGEYEFPLVLLFTDIHRDLQRVVIKHGHGREVEIRRALSLILMANRWPMSTCDFSMIASNSTSLFVVKVKDDIIISNIGVVRAIMVPPKVSNSLCNSSSQHRWRNQLGHMHLPCSSS